RQQAPAGRGARHHPRARGAQAPARAHGLLGAGARPGVRRGARREPAGVLPDAARPRPAGNAGAARAARRRGATLRWGVPRPRGAAGELPREPAPLRNIESALEVVRASYAGKTRYTQLEYESLLANASIGIAFTRDKRFFLCNPKFAEMFGYRAEELVGQPGEVLYVSRDSYTALGRIA